MTSEDIAMELLKDGVLCSPGSAFGPSGEGHLRFAYTISQEDITRGMDKVGNFATSSISITGGEMSFIASIGYFFLGVAIAVLVPRFPFLLMTRTKGFF